MTHYQEETMYAVLAVDSGTWNADGTAPVQHVVAVGETPDAAVEDAHEQMASWYVERALDDGSYIIVRATERLVREVLDRGGDVPVEWTGSPAEVDGCAYAPVADLGEDEWQ